MTTAHIHNILYEYWQLKCLYLLVLTKQKLTVFEQKRCYHLLYLQSQVCLEITYWCMYSYIVMV
jgi:hypothetical protein